MTPRIITRQEREDRKGIGTAIQTVIHAGVDLAPLPAKTKRAIKNCIPCNQRARRWNRAGKNLRAWTLKQFNKGQ